MKYILILILINLFFTSAIYVLFLKKSNDNSNYTSTNGANGTADV